ncbi:MAG: hypothetical protein C4320_02165 [Armatimonadota bacterium]
MAPRPYRASPGSSTSPTPTGGSEGERPIRWAVSRAHRGTSSASATRIIQRRHGLASLPITGCRWIPMSAGHAVLHLLYARFWTKVLYDEGLISQTEPFRSLKNQGQVLARTPYRAAREGEQLAVGSDGILVSFQEAETLPPETLTWRWTRMSKSKGNVVTPEEAVAAHGADALRLTLLFRAPFDADIQWENEGMRDSARFLSRIFRLMDVRAADYDPLWSQMIGVVELGPTGRAIRKATHTAIGNVTADIERFSFNTYVSELMKYVNELNRLHSVDAESSEENVELAWSEALETLPLLLSPGAPHSGDELWESLGKEGSTFTAPWPSVNPELIVEEEIEIAVQVNGKLRDRMIVPPGLEVSELQSRALDLTNVRAHTEGKTLRKVIVVEDRLVNLVVS